MAGINELWHLSRNQIHDILKVFKGLVKKGDITLFFPRKFNKSDCLLKYQIFYNKEKRWFDLIFYRAKSFKPSKGAEVANYCGWQLEIFLDKNFKRKKIQNILQKDIQERKNGLLVEKTFCKNMQALIARDEEVSKIIKFIKTSEYYDDAVRKIDFSIVLAPGKEVPVQIKSSSYGQNTHRKKYPNIPSLVYNIEMPEVILKEKILQICKNYPRIIENL